MNWREMLTQELKHLTVARRLQIRFDPDKCAGVWECYEVCPVGCWVPDLEARKAIFHNADRCIACSACVLQCPEEAIKLDTSTPR
jgi:NAD-dependent dihydropyrimidine dehydrogenase PreA subunit